MMRIYLQGGSQKLLLITKESIVSSSGPPCTVLEIIWVSCKKIKN